MKPSARIETKSGRILRVRAVPVGIRFGCAGQVVAANGRVIHETETYPSEAREAAEAAARRWVEREYGR